MIAIKNMKMPSCCDECKIYDNGSEQCPITWTNCLYPEDERNDDCPLVEIKESDDCVSRKAVVEFLNNHAEDFDDKKIKMVFKTSATLVNNVDNIPLVTPTHITCKDCKHCMKDFSFSDKPMCLSHALSAVTDNFYCADAERRE